MVKLFASALYTASVLLTAVHACVWESSGDVVGNLTLYCADVATGARLEPTSTTAPMVSVDAPDALQVYVRADATQEILNADASDWTTAYNASVVAPASGGYSVVLVCGKPDGGACHVSYGLQWASPVPVHRALATETGCYFSGSYMTGFMDSDLVFTCYNVQPGLLKSTVSSSSDKFSTAFYDDASNFARYDSGNSNTCLIYGCSTTSSGQTTTTEVVVTSSGSYTFVIRCQNLVYRCTVNADIYFNTDAALGPTPGTTPSATPGSTTNSPTPGSTTKAPTPGAMTLTPTPGATTSSGASSTCPVPGTFQSTDMRLELSSSGSFAQTNDGGNGVTCSTTGTYEVSGQKASFTVSTVSAECRSLFTPGQKYSGPFSFSSSCQQLTLGYATTTQTLQRVSSAPMASVTMLLAVLLAWCAL